MEVVSQMGLKPPKSFIKTTVIGILSLKTTNTWLFDNSGDHTWQPLLVSSHPILDFLEPWAGGGELLLEKNPVLKEFFNSCVPYAEG